MSFSIGKILWLLVNPGNFCVLILAAGLIWRGRGGRAFLVLGTAGLAVISVLPLSGRLAQPLEDRFLGNPPLPERVDGIIVLGGAIEPWLSRERGQIILNDAAERLTETMALARRHPEARVLFSGGNGNLLQEGGAEAVEARTFFGALGLDPARLLVEDESRTTYENVIFSQALVKPAEGENWVVVTSAIHMPRAVGCFRRAGWRVIPYPVDYRTPPAGRRDFDFDLARGLAIVVRAAREWVGLAAYRLLDRTDAFFPGREQ